VTNEGGNGDGRAPNDAPQGNGGGGHAGGPDAEDWGRLWDDLACWRSGRGKIDDCLAILEAGIPGVRPDFRGRYDITLDEAIELLEREHAIWKENLLPRLTKARRPDMFPPWPL
jgi:hypothetical protein